MLSGADRIMCSLHPLKTLLISDEDDGIVVKGQVSGGHVTVGRKKRFYACPGNAGMEGTRA